MSCQPEMPHFICIHGKVCFLSAFGCELGGVYLPLALVNASEQKTRHSGHSAELLHQIVFTVVILSKPNIQMSSSETMEWPSPDNTTSNRKLHAPKKDKQRKDKMIAVFQLQYLTYRTMYKMCQSTSLYKSKVIWHPEVKFFLDLLN